MRALSVAVTVVAVGAVALCVNNSSASADDCLCGPPVVYVAPSPAPVYVSPVVVTPPVVVYQPPVYVPPPVYYTPVVRPVPVYHPVPAPLYYKQEFEARRHGYEYEYKVYSPYRRHRPIYKYEVEVRRGHVEIEERFH